MTVKAKRKTAIDRDKEHGRMAAEVMHGRTARKDMAKKLAKLKLRFDELSAEMEKAQDERGSFYRNVLSNSDEIDVINSRLQALERKRWWRWW